MEAIKIQMDNLKNYAELAWASYGYFDCINNQIFILISPQKFKGAI